MSEDEINDKSKGDFFTKLIVVIQTSWFIIQCISRWIQQLHVTELEIITLAFAVLNIISYILWWNKPQNMRVAIPIFENCGSCGAAAEKKDKVDGRNTIKSPPRSEQASSCGEQSGLVKEEAPLLDKERNKDDYLAGIKGVCSALLRLTSVFGCAILGLPHASWAFIKAINPVAAYCIMIGDHDNFGVGTSHAKAAFHSCTGGTKQEGAVSLTIGFIGLLFGGVHLLPLWLSTFPSARDKSLWTASTIYVLVEPVLVSFVAPVFVWFPNLLSAPALILMFPHTVGFLLYVVARLILIVLAFTNLRSLPSDAFVNVEWSTFFPHI